MLPLKQANRNKLALTSEWKWKVLKWLIGEQDLRMGA